MVVSNQDDQRQVGSSTLVIAASRILAQAERDIWDSLVSPLEEFFALFVGLASSLANVRIQIRPRRLL